MLSHSIAIASGTEMLCPWAVCVMEEEETDGRRGVDAVIEMRTTGRQRGGDRLWGRAPRLIRIGRLDKSGLGLVFIPIEGQRACSVATALFFFIPFIIIPNGPMMGFMSVLRFISSLSKLLFVKI